MAAAAGNSHNNDDAKMWSGARVFGMLLAVGALCAVLFAVLAAVLFHVCLKRHNSSNNAKQQQGYVLNDA
jgi:hypothetical protein